MAVVQPLNELKTYLLRLRTTKLWLQVLIASALGIVLGLVLNPSNNILSAEQAVTTSQWLNLPGSIFMKLIQMIIIPLIFTSILTGVISNDNAQLRKMGPRLLGYFLITTTVAIVIGVTLTQVLKPGLYFSGIGGLTGHEEIVSTPLNEGTMNIPEVIANLIPSNPLASMLSGEMLGVVIFTVIVSLAITQLENRMSKPLIRFFEAVQKICMIIVSWAMFLVPVAVFGMMAALVSTLGAEAILGLGYYILVVIIGLIILLFFYMLIVWLVGKQNPFKFLKAISSAQLLAFSTSSSAAVMPLSMEVADKNLGVSSKISDFIVPIGATINMDGTAVFQCITALFVAQSYGLDLGVSTIIVLMISIIGASIGTPAVPGGGVVILASVLGSFGIPAEGLLVIIGIDRILGMFRTVLNVTGDLTTCVIFNRWYG